MVPFFAVGFSYMGFGPVGKGFHVASVLSGIDKSSPDDRITRLGRWAEWPPAPASDAYES